MSAFLVDPAHIAELAKWAMAPGLNTIDSWYNHFARRQITVETPAKLANILAVANLVSVGHRYGTDDDREMPGRILGANQTYLGQVAAHFTGIRIATIAASLRAADIVQMVRCLAYQCCEVDRWIEADAYWILKDIKDEAAVQLAAGARVRWEYRPEEYAAAR